MRKGKYIFTSESVTEGHPDKVCDQISDSILDCAIRDDPNSRVAAETFTKTGFVIVGGEMTTKTYVPVSDLVRNTIKEIGYTDPKYGFDYESCGVLVSISEQSPDIAMGVDRDDIGAGDQGMMFGYATKETSELMPLPITLAHKLTAKLAELRKNKTIPYLRPDGKAQVSVNYENKVPVSVNTVVVSTQHDPDVSHEQIENDVIEKIVKPVCGDWLAENVAYHINPTGQFIIGGPVADAGLTGRKIIVDTYGGVGAHGGGAFSGKDPTKVDRSGAYASRYIAKNLVAAGLCDRVEVQLAYAIGVADPVSIMVAPHGGIKEITGEEMVDAIRAIFPLKPGRIIKELDLLRPIYRKTAAYGHFGRNDPDFTWERTDKADELKDWFKKYL